MTDFADTLAVATLVDEAREAGAGEALPVATIVREAASAGTPGAAVIPFAALPLYRALRAQRAAFTSPAALAASTGEEQVRVVGEVTLRTVVEDDVTFLMIALPAGWAPQTVELLAPDGHLVRLALDPPIDGVVQMGFSRLTFADREVVALLGSPSTTIYLV